MRTVPSAVAWRTEGVIPLGKKRPVITVVVRMCVRRIERDVIGLITSEYSTGRNHVIPTDIYRP